MQEYKTYFDHIHMIFEAEHQANTYLLDAGVQQILIDAGAPEARLEGLNRNRLQSIYLTHGHYDHITHLKEWKETRGLKAYIHSDDQIMLTNPMLNMSVMNGCPMRGLPADGFIKDGEIINLSPVWQLQVVATPGHTKGSCCFLLWKKLTNNSPEPVALFTGDTLLGGKLGRTDFPGGVPPLMSGTVERLKALMYALPESVAMFFGHGRPSTVGIERKFNPFLRKD
ncbi:MAG: MBL fold metallo-hydrolase [Fastidiosipilaceae bacterium]|jgi:hydroxyacylglutathione hydrolase|nr:MBL fold metallo-hydrolase [Clostridiaceae bacterium]